DHANLPAAVDVVLAMLQVDDTNHAAAAHERHREERLIAILGKFVEELETGIVRGFFRNGHGFTMLRYPSGNSFPDVEFQAVDDFEMRVFRSPQHQFIALKNVDKTGVALDQCGSKFNHPVQNFVEFVAGSKASANVMKDVNM